MRNEFCERLKRRRVAGHFPSLGNLDDINPNTSMFIEDIHIGVMPPSGGFRQTTDFSVDLQGSPDDEHRAMVILQSLRVFG